MLYCCLSMPLPVIPKKSLGQNFLNSDRVVTRIIDAANPVADDLILEIGPGLGVITKKLLQTAGKVVAVEKDPHLYTILSDQFSKELSDGTLELISGDILDFDPTIFQSPKYAGFHYKIAANIPYNITGLIIRKFLSASHQPETMVLLIQKEVADRIIARDEKESLLSLSVKLYGIPKLVTNVSRGNFNPPPRVDSAVIQITHISRGHFPEKACEDLFFKIIHAGFAHKRKVLLKNLVEASIASREILEKIFTERNLLATIRAEDLRLEDWIFITNIVYTTL